MDKLIKAAMLGFTGVKLAQRAQRFSVAAMCAVFGLFTALGALGCAVAALWIHLEPEAGAVGAALWCSLALLAITAALLIAAKTTMSGPPRHTPNVAVDDVAAEIRRGMSNNKTSVLLAALLAGLMMGRR